MTVRSPGGLVSYATIAAPLVLDALALDDITTGTEADLRAEYLMVARSIAIIAALLHRLNRGSSDAVR